MKRPEQLLQKSICSYLDRQYPDLLYFHVPNASNIRGKRGAIIGQHLKEMGRKPGVPDLFFFWTDAALNYCGAIELKAGKKGLEDSQIKMQGRLAANGVIIATCRSIEEVQATLQEWGIPKNKRRAGW